MGNNKLVDILGLSRYHENLKGLLNEKQAVIDDLDDIRSGAALGATALQEVPAEYVTETELAGKNYATVDQVNAKQDIISDLETIRSGAAAGAAALDAAKGYADSLVKDAEGKSLFDEAGAAAEALDAAKEYVDGKVDGKFDAAGTAAGLDAAMDARVKVLEAIDHVQLAADASAAAVATVLDGAPEKFDTLKEVAQWIADSESAATAADLVTRVAALEAIDHDAYVDADAALKSELEGEIAKKVDAVEGSRLMTDAEGTKLDGIEAGAQVNVIESLEINGVEATITDKKASVTLDCYTKDEVNAIVEENERVTAEALTDLDARVKDLKDTTYNKTEIDTMVGNVIVVASNDDIDNLFN